MAWWATGRHWPWPGWCLSHLLPLILLSHFGVQLRDSSIHNLKSCMIAAPHKGTRLSTLGPQNLNRSARQGDETTLDNLGVNMYTTCVYVCLYVCLSVCMCVCLSVWIANFLGDYVLELVHQLIVRWQSDYCFSAFVTGSQQLGVLSQKGHRYESPLAMESISMIYTLTSRLHAIRTPHARLTMSFVRRRNL